VYEKVDVRPHAFISEAVTSQISAPVPLSPDRKLSGPQGAEARVKLQLMTPLS
jgi:hypothetical protein